MKPSSNIVYEYLPSSSAYQDMLIESLLYIVAVLLRHKQGDSFEVITKEDSLDAPSGGYLFER